MSIVCNHDVFLCILQRRASFLLKIRRAILVDIYPELFNAMSAKKVQKCECFKIFAIFKINITKKKNSPGTGSDAVPKSSQFLEKNDSNPKHL